MHDARASHSHHLCTALRSSLCQSWVCVSNSCHKQNTHKKRVPFGLEYLLQHLCKADPRTGGPQTSGVVERRSYLAKASLTEDTGIGVRVFGGDILEDAILLGCVS